MNLGAFVVVIAVAERGIGDELAAFRGLGRRAPFAAATMAVFLFSLTGLPPLSPASSASSTSSTRWSRAAAPSWSTLAVIGILNSALSLYYYARVLKTMYFEAPADEAAVPLPPLHASLLALLAVPTVALFVVWSPLVRFVDGSLAQW